MFFDEKGEKQPYISAVDILVNPIANACSFPSTITS